MLPATRTFLTCQNLIEPFLIEIIYFLKLPKKLISDYKNNLMTNTVS